MSDKPKCELCGEPMPDGEEMFKYHGYSGPCPKPPLPRSSTPRTDDELFTVSHGFGKDSDKAVSAGFCRKLERELIAACEERDRYKADSENWRNTAFFMLNVEYEERKRLLDLAVSHDK